MPGMFVPAFSIYLHNYQDIGGTEDEEGKRDQDHRPLNELPPLPETGL